MAVQQSMSIYNQRKAETVNRLVGSMREATNLCNGCVVLSLQDFVCVCPCLPLCVPACVSMRGLEYYNVFKGNLFI